MLVNAAAGAVGSLLVQIARRAGADVVIAAVSTEKKMEFVRKLGADVCINYTRPDWAAELHKATGGKGPDTIYESAGGAVTMASLQALAPLGEMVIYGALNIQSFQLGVPDLLCLIFKNQSISGFALAPLLTNEALRSGLVELFDLAVSDHLKTTSAGVFPLEHAAEAHRALETRSTIGKVVLAA